MYALMVVVEPRFSLKQLIFSSYLISLRKCLFHRKTVVEDQFSQLGNRFPVSEMRELNYSNRKPVTQDPKLLFGNRFRLR